MADEEPTEASGDTGENSEARQIPDFEGQELFTDEGSDLEDNSDDSSRSN